MNKKVLAIIAGIVLVIIAGFIYVASSNSDRNAMDDMQESQLLNDVQPPTPEPTNSASTPGTYATYNEHTVAATSGTKLLFFHAPWCPQCRALEKDIKESTIPDGTSIFKVDYDSNQALRRKYGVTIQTTVVKVDDQGNLVKKYVAYDEPTLAAVLQNTR